MTEESSNKTSAPEDGSPKEDHSDYGLESHTDNNSSARLTSDFRGSGSLGSGSVGSDFLGEQILSILSEPSFPEDYTDLSTDHFTRLYTFEFQALYPVIEILREPNRYAEQSDNPEMTGEVLSKNAVTALRHVLPFTRLTLAAQALSTVEENNAMMLSNAEIFLDPVMASYLSNIASFSDRLTMMIFNKINEVRTQVLEGKTSQIELNQMTGLEVLCIEWCKFLLPLYLSEDKKNLINAECWAECVKNIPWDAFLEKTAQHLEQEDIFSPIPFLEGNNPREQLYSASGFWSYRLQINLLIQEMRSILNPKPIQDI